MAKYKRIPLPMKAKPYAYPSRYGSHSSMVDEEKTNQLSSEDEVVIKDELGFYTTKRSLLDTGLADPKRYSTNRVKLGK